MTMELRSLIWDVDGTLAETEETHRAAFNQAFAEAGLSWRWERSAYAELLRVSGGRERIAHFMATSEGANAPPGLVIAALHARKTEIYNEMLASGRVGLRPGVARLFRRAQAAGIVQAICTTTSRVNVANLMRATLGENAPDFAAVVAGEDAYAKKPDPEAYRLVLSLLNLPPESCLAVEDSQNGLRAARAAGIPVLAVPGEYTTGDDFSGAAAVMDSLGEAELDDIRAVRLKFLRDRAV